ncbi:methyl-accepting chemotaxis protein [Bdellovibrio bacteriovorus]|uniref:Methyl-accepting chemotaxis protein n=1 Tax=Bdellovibrio bacteriovorus str. Tiberius TaxID=1069642 RepID=K7ZET1_BDEBC|nr:methyl-accepting chemotaxis protein [Bdellovibrio bacteriovorus]AFY00802.1 methyl-accepting chemotaxis protein [Bdellovibrio bacteriovorus str. Tiberius]
MGFRKKLLVLIFSAIGLGSTALIVTGSMATRSALEKQVQEQLLSHGLEAKANVVGHSQRLLNYALQVQDSRLIEGMFIAYEGAFYGAALVPGKDVQAYTPAFEILNRTFFDRTKRMAQDFSFDDIVLVSTNAQIVFSLADSKTSSVFLGKNLVNGAFKDLKIGSCYRAARDSKKSDLIFSGFGVNPELKKVVGFLCQAKKAEFDHLADGVKKGDTLGVVISKINIEALEESASWKFGAGKTGVSYLLGSDQILRTSYSPSQGRKIDAALAIQDDLKFDSKAIEIARSGKEGVLTAANPLGLEVISFSSPVEVFNETWVLVAEKETSEVFAPVKNMIWLLVSLGALICAGIGIVSFFVLRSWIEQLRGISAKMLSTSEVISANGGQLNSSSSRMSEGASRGAAALEETVASLSEISSMVDANSVNAQKAYQLSLRNSESASQGSAKISQLIDSMRIVAERAGKVSEITMVIEDIAFQTNLLALNASVEAARAGDQGKGFAVVADAVRALAQKSSSSAKEISVLIQDTVVVANKGRKEADESGDVLSGIISSIQQTTEINQSISDASREQTTGTREISSAMNSIDQLTQQNAALAISVQESSEELSLQAKNLKVVFADLNSFLNGDKRGGQECQGR